MRLDQKTRRTLSRLADEIATVAAAGLALPGTLTHRMTRCGRAGCRCGGDPPVLHGPYWSWTRKVASKTVTAYLSDEQVEEYQAYFDNARRLRALIGELESLSLEVAANDPRSRPGRTPRRASG